MSFSKPKIDLTPPWDVAPIGKNRVRPIPAKPPKPKKFSREPQRDNYKEQVHVLTEQNKHLVEGIHTRAYSQYHIDHKISKRFGFDNNIPPEHIAHPSNLHMMWWKDNVAKGTSNIVDEGNMWILSKK